MDRDPARLDRDPARLDGDLARLDGDLARLEGDLGLPESALDRAEPSSRDARRLAARRALPLRFHCARTWVELRVGDCDSVRASSNPDPNPNPNPNYNPKASPDPSPEPRRTSADLSGVRVGVGDSGERGDLASFSRTLGEAVGARLARSSRTRPALCSRSSRAERARSRAAFESLSSRREAMVAVRAPLREGRP